MQTLDAIKTRRTIRKFTEEPVSHEVIEKIVVPTLHPGRTRRQQDIL